MSLSSKTELARALFRTPSPDSVTRISGTATADSADGTVTVQLEDGDVIEVGTIGSVSSGDTVTIHVQRGEAQVIASEGWGDAMQAAVDEAQAIAEATGQHFWHDTNGAHVTEVTADQWAQSQTGHNILVNSLGILLRKALNYIAAWTGSALSFYDGNGNAASNVTASFGSAGAQIGKVDESHLEMDYHSMRMLDRGGNEYFRVADLADSDSYVQYTFYGDGSTVTWELPADGLSLGVPDVMLYDSGGQSAGRPSSAEVGYNADGYYIRILPAVASGYYAVAKIEITSTSVPYVTFGTRGDGNIGMNSAALGESLVAATKDQTVVGKFNVEDYGGQDALIVGNGTADNARSNAFTVDWSGNVEAAGDVRAGGSTPLVPIGTILDFAAATAPSGYLVCDGSAVSRTTYAALFAVIGTTWGSGNGSTTFNVPDLRGRTAIGAGTGTASDATAHALGSNGGTETHKLTAAQSGVPAHAHPLANSSIVYNNASSNTSRMATSGSGTKISVNTNVGLNTYNNTAADASSAHPNMQPYAAVTKIIRAI